MDYLDAVRMLEMATASIRDLKREVKKLEGKIVSQDREYVAIQDEYSFTYHRELEGRVEKGLMRAGFPRPSYGDTYIAAVEKMIDAIEKMQEKIEAYEDALSFYAHPHAWERDADYYIAEDRGMKAKEALVKWSKEPYWKEFK